MHWGKATVSALIVLMLSGCNAAIDPSANPTSQTTPTSKTTPTVPSSATPSAPPSSNLVIKKITGDAEADWFIAVLNASCEAGKTRGLAAYVKNRHTTIYSLPVKDEWSYGMQWTMFTKTSGNVTVGGWPDGDVVCNEAGYASRVVAKGSPANNDGVVFDYKLVKVSDSTFDWSDYRQSSDFRPVRFTVENDLVSKIKMPEKDGYEYRIGYGPFSSQLNKSFQAALVEANAQYLYLSPPLWGMTLAQAEAYCKKHGLTVVVGEEDGVDNFPSGPPGGKSDPKRMIVNLMRGTIFGVWTM